MDWMAHLLTLILFTPSLVALVLVFVPGEEKTLLRWTAFLGSLIPLALTLVLWFNFKSGLPGFQFEEKFIWYEALNSTYHLGVDGLSLTMVLLTTLLTPIALLASFNITDRVKPYMILLLLLEMGMLGVFISLDLLLFFVFWEVELIPMYFLISIWGTGRKEYSAIKYVIYTLVGSAMMLTGPVSWRPS